MLRGHPMLPVALFISVKALKKKVILIFEGCTCFVAIWSSSFHEPKKMMCVPIQVKSHKPIHSKYQAILRWSIQKIILYYTFVLKDWWETVTRPNLKSIYKDIMHYPSSIRRSSSSFSSSYPYYVTLFA